MTLEIDMENPCHGKSMSWKIHAKNLQDSGSEFVHRSEVVAANPSNVDSLLELSMNMQSYSK